MSITRNQTEAGKVFPFLDHNKPGYDRDVDAIASDDIRPNVIQVASVDVTAAEMLAMRASPKTLIAAPGTGKYLEFLGASFLYKYAAAFTESSDDIVIRYTDSSGAVASNTLDATGLLDATSNQIRTFRALATDVSPVANSPLVLHNTGDGEWGGTGSPCTVKISYRVHNTGF